jgi:hypothetical protein
VIAIIPGWGPALIGLPGVLVAVVIGVTVFEAQLETYTVCPLGVIAIQMGAFPALIGVPTVLVAVVIGVTVSALQLAT